jgi:8-oxo-dGTP pyrophosphatase MutT (NUDIX family)
MTEPAGERVPAAAGPQSAADPQSAAGRQSAAGAPRAAGPLRAAHPLPAADALPGAAAAPDWLRPLVNNATSAPLPGPLAGNATASADSRSSAVLILFSNGTGPGGTGRPDVLITARADTLRAHAGQPAFPGGRAEPGEDPIATALRESNEETGLDPSSVTPLLQLRELYLGHSGYRVVPIVGYWSAPGRVWAVDPAETAAVARVPIAQLVDPSRRGRVRLSQGLLAPAFEVGDMIVWGFTALLLDAVLELGGWNRPWLPGRDLVLPRDSVVLR